MGVVSSIPGNAHGSALFSIVAIFRADKRVSLAVIGGNVPVIDAYS